VESAISLSQNRIAVLTGRVPGADIGGQRDALPELPPIPGTGLPGDLLVRRPDVRAARLRAEAADHRVAAAVADRLPSLRLSGSLGKQSGDITEIFTVPTVWSVLGQLIAPLVDGGRRKAEVERNEAVVDERLADYGQALLSAIVEVDSAIVQENQQILYVAQLAEQVEVAGAALQDAQARYREGLSEQGFLQVLTALQTQQRAELSLLSARRQLVSFRIQLCRALGGTWTSSLEATRPNKREN
jgi:outer membrane protein TolC